MARLDLLHDGDERAMLIDGELVEAQSGKRFENVNPAIGFTTAQGIGARMIQHANYLAQLGYQVTQAPDPVTV